MSALPDISNQASEMEMAQAKSREDNQIKQDLAKYKELYDKSIDTIGIMNDEIKQHKRTIKTLQKLMAQALEKVVR